MDKRRPLRLGNERPTFAVTQTLEYELLLVG
jgi:hypothetical protein